MKRYITPILSIACLSSGLLYGYVQNEAQAAPQTGSSSSPQPQNEPTGNHANSPFSFKYDEIQQKKDEFKHEIFLKNPVFTISNPPDGKCEISLKGTLNIVLNFKENHLETVSDGIIHFFLVADSTSRPVDATVDGKMTGTMDADLAKIKRSLLESKSNELSDQDLIGLLDSIKAASVGGNNLKVVNKLLPNGVDNLTLVDVLNFGYRQTTGPTPVEITFKSKAKHSSSFVGYGGVFGFPEGKDIDADTDIKLLLPDWKKLAAFLNYKELKSLPEGLFDMKIQAKSSLGEGVWESIFSSKQEDPAHTTMESKLHYNAQSVPDWVEQIQKLKKGNLDKDSRSKNTVYTFFENSVYQWVVSPKTTAFLKLLPLQLTFDWDGALTYSDTTESYIDKGIMDTSIIGKTNSGLKINSIYEKNELNAKVVLLGGRPTFDYGVALFNSFSDSMNSHWKLPHISLQAGDELYKLLSKYSDQPEKVNDELKITLKYSKEGDLTIGNKKFSQFQADIMDFLKKYLDDSPKSQNTSSTVSST